MRRGQTHPATGPSSRTHPRVIYAVGPTRSPVRFPMPMAPENGRENQNRPPTRCRSGSFPKVHRFPCEPPVHPRGRSTGHAWRPPPWRPCTHPTCRPVSPSRNPPELTRVNRQRVEAIRKTCPPKGRQCPVTCRTAKRLEGRDSSGRAESHPPQGARRAIAPPAAGGRGSSPPGRTRRPVPVAHRGAGIIG